MPQEEPSPVWRLPCHLTCGRCTRLMLRCRLFEEAVAQLWRDGLISGEMHLGTGEEAIIAGIVPQLLEGDALALDHRGTAALLLRGVEPASILPSCWDARTAYAGAWAGTCTCSPGSTWLPRRASSARRDRLPLVFALAARTLRPGTLAVAFFGEGAMNQGMLLEALNLAAVWTLPVLFVCKDDGWSITTPSSAMTGGDLGERARGLGVRAVEIDGRDVDQVWEAAGQAIALARAGEGPTFLHARCVHLEGHFLGYQPLRVTRDPLREMPRITGPLVRAFTRPGGARLCASVWTEWALSPGRSQRRCATPGASAAMIPWLARVISCAQTRRGCENSKRPWRQETNTLLAAMRQEGGA